MLTIWATGDEVATAREKEWDEAVRYAKAAAPQKILSRSFRVADLKKGLDFRDAWPCAATCHTKEGKGLKNSKFNHEMGIADLNT